MQGSRECNVHKKPDRNRKPRPQSGVSFRKREKRIE